MLTQSSATLLETATRINLHLGHWRRTKYACARARWIRIEAEVSEIAEGEGNGKGKEEIGSRKEGLVQGLFSYLYVKIL